MVSHAKYFTLLLLLGLTTTASSIKCSRRIDGISMPPLQLEGKFKIVIATLNRTEIVDQYMPGVKYMVSIEGERTSYGPLKFTRFLLTAENKDDDSIEAGSFDLADEMLTQFSDKCPSAVIERNQIPKVDVTVFWTSPPEGSTCVLIRATVVENEENWYIDEGTLVRTICQNPKAVQDNPGVVLDECCACDEAKYEVTFEGLWSRNTHPKDFPSKGWLIRFSDVIGASHTVDYRFWKIDELASKGLQQVAELGSTRTLESELKRESANIRTIIKARGITYPNVTGRTFAVFRVDRKHHLMSLVSMIVPSPDWIVGVSGLELCLSNCSWIEHKELNLYPVDAGTDDGITYTSPDSPIDPHESIRVITTSYPNDTRSPFYDASGQDMKPMAKLHLNRQRLYEKTCEDIVGPTTNEDGEKTQKQRVPKACRTGPWTDWSECPSTCQQLKQRSYLNETAASARNCTQLLTDRQPCSSHPDCLGRDNLWTANSEECSQTEWSSWSECSKPCSDSHQKRTRKFKYKRFSKKCRILPDIPPLQETAECPNSCSNPEYETIAENILPGMNFENMKNNVEKKGDDDGSEGQSDGNEEEEEEDDENEEFDDESPDYIASPLLMEVTEEWMQKCQSDMYSQWSSWSPCSSSCGRGTSSRTRYPIDNSDVGMDECRIEAHNCTAEIASCEYSKSDAIEICNEPLLTGECREHYRRNYFDKKTNTCKSFVWTGCRMNRNNFATLQECEKVCLEDARSEDDDLFNGISSGSQVTRPASRDGQKVDCQFTKWSEWSRCENCRGYRYRSRSILVQAQNGGKKCPTKLIRKMRCVRLPDCSNEMTGRRKRFRDRSSNCESKHWSPWSRCNASCGESHRHRTRNSEIQERDSHRKRCKKLVEFQKCSTFPCP